MDLPVLWGFFSKVISFPFLPPFPNTSAFLVVKQLEVMGTFQYISWVYI